MNEETITATTSPELQAPVETARAEPVESVHAEIVVANEGNDLLRTIKGENYEAISFFGFDETSPEGVVRVFNAQEDGESLDASGLTDLVLEGIILRPGTRVDPVSGSRTACVNTILMTADGDYVSQSNGIARTAARIVSLYGATGWPEAGIHVRVVEQNLAGGRTYKKLRLVA